MRGLAGPSRLPLLPVLFPVVLMGLDDLLDHRGVVQGRQVAQVACGLCGHLPQHPPHDLPRASLRKPLHHLEVKYQGNPVTHPTLPSARWTSAARSVWERWVEPHQEMLRDGVFGNFGGNEFSELLEDGRRVTEVVLQNHKGKRHWTCKHTHQHYRQRVKHWHQTLARRPNLARSVIIFGLRGDIQWLLQHVYIILQISEYSAQGRTFIERCYSDLIGLLSLFYFSIYQPVEKGYFGHSNQKAANKKRAVWFLITSYL